MYRKFYSMRTSPHSPVREHQRLVLATLHLARGSVTPAQIAGHLNSLRDHTGLAETSSIEIEAALAALLLRPELRGLISCATRRATKTERGHRARLQLGGLATVVILSACATSRPVAPDPVATLPNYFGGNNVVAKETTRASRPVFPGASYVVADDIAHLPSIDIVPFASKSPANDTVSVSYFSDYLNDESSNTFAARAEADLASPEMLTPPSRSLLLAEVHPVPSAVSFSETFATARLPFPVRPLGLGDVAHALNQISPPLVLSLASSDEPFRVVTISRTDQSSFSSTSRLLDLSKVSAAPPLVPSHSTPHSPISLTPLAVGPALPTGVYDDLVTFTNGSMALSAQAHSRVIALIDAAKAADCVQLRGRVGNRFLTPEMAKQAVGRAVAVRELLVLNGVPRDKVRIQNPRNNDFINPSSPADESNRSVTVLMKLPPTVADGLGILPGRHISSPKTLASASQ